MTEGSNARAEATPIIAETDLDGVRHIVLTEVQLKRLVAEGVDDALTRLGIEHNNPLEMQKDFQHLRDWRTATDSVRRKGMAALIGVLVAGACGALWVGLKEMLQR